MSKRPTNEYSSLISMTLIEIDLFYQSLPEYDETIKECEKNYKLIIKNKDIQDNAKLHLLKALVNKATRVNVGLMRKQRTMDGLEQRINKYLDSYHPSKEQYFYTLNAYKTKKDEYDRKVNLFLLDCVGQIDKIEDKIFKDAEFKL